MDFKDNKQTQSLSKYEKLLKIKKNFSLGSDAVSLRFVIEALRGINSFNEKVVKMEAPKTLILKAEEDKVVSNNFVIQNPHFSIGVLKRTRHAVNIEKKEFFEEAIRRTLNFFRK